ncbi:MAG: acyl-CoA dehydrogenase family protein [Rhodobacteraceae bacterium]|nr:acyl-CoA dehydrogenase family protein [Paracoccaceae bacterium]
MNKMTRDMHLIETARDLRPMLRSNAAESAEQRRLAKPSADALRNAGFFQMMTPRRAGGSQASIREYCEVCEELSRGDSAAGWTVMIAGGNAFLMGLLPDRLRDEVYKEDPLATIVGQWAPTAKSEKVDGGFVLTGKWPWASGCYEAQWNFVGSPVFDETGKMIDVRVSLVPTTELTIEDTWHVAGMAGTGSNTFVGENVYVPEHRTVLMSDVTGGKNFSDHEDEAIYNAPIVTALPLGICAAALGMAESIWDLTLEGLERGKPIVGSTYRDSRFSPSYQLNLADARGAIDSARLHILRAADDLDAAAQASVRPDDLARARIRLDEAVALKRVREAVDLLLNIGGASVFMLSNPVQRIWRDIETCTRHAYTNGDLGREIYAKALLGQPQVSESF